VAARLALSSLPYPAAMVGPALLLSLAPWQLRAEPLPTTLPRGSLAPRLAQAQELTTLSWLEPTADGAHALRLATLRFDTQRPANPSSGELAPWPRPAVESSALFVNWADTPGVMPLGPEVAIAHWLECPGTDPHVYDLRAARTDDGGASWRDLGHLHRDGAPAEHGFASLVPGPTGLTAFWLDGRQRSGGHGHGSSGATALYTAHLSDAVRQELLLDESVCDCCPTAAVATADGPLVAYRDRVLGSERRDINLVRWLGDRWSDPQPVCPDGWELPGCPVNGPALAARGAEVVLAWFSGADGPRLRLARSIDGGESFELAGDPGAGLLTHGRPALAFDGSGGLWLVQLAEAAGRGGWFGTYYPATGEALGPTLLVETRITRSAGMPALVASPDGVWLATTAVGESGPERVQLWRLVRD
jgi:hypothetical protein